MMKESWQRGFLYVMPVISTIFILALPAAVQLSFAFTSTMSLTQSHCLRQPWFREMLGIHPLPAPAPATPTSESPYKGTITIQASSTTVSEQPPAPKGIIQGALSDIKGAASQLMKTARSLRKSDDTKKGTQRLTPAELKRAQAYEEQKQREIAQEKLEARRRENQGDDR
jgi:membrane protein insertase Oxa1/YidC/SpoIIIJ